MLDVHLYGQQGPACNAGKELMISSTGQPTTLDSSSAIALTPVICLSNHGVSVDETDDLRRVVTTVFELAGQDQSGLLADVTHLLTTNGCDVRSAAVRHGSQLLHACTPAYLCP